MYILYGKMETEIYASTTCDFQEKATRDKIDIFL